MPQPVSSPVTQIETPPSTILVVDDEVLIRFVVADFLRECGFQVLEAASADEAVTLLSSQETTIDLVFTDVQMPGQNDGFSLARWVRKNQPGVHVILTSGVARTAELGEDLCDLGPIESKPYAFEPLAARIKRALAENGRNRPQS